MPFIEQRVNNDGEITSYKIVVSDGYDPKGKQKRYRMIWTPSKPGMTPRQMEKEALSAAYKFESEIQKGYKLDNNRKFSEYAEYVINLKESRGVRPSTITRYREMMPRINEAIGHIPIGKLRPQHLNELYTDLQKNGVCSGTERAISKRQLKRTLIELGLSKASIAREAGVSASTLTVAVRGESIRVDTAKAICNALDMEFDELFQIEENRKPLSPKTILEHHRLISSILAQADKELLIPYNPAAKATPPHVGRTTPDYYQPDEMEDILKALDDEPIKWKSITYMLIDTGCRRGEIMGLKWKNVNLETGLIVIESALLYTPSKGTYEGDTKTEKPER